MTRFALLAAAAAATLFAFACGGSGGSGATATPSPEPTGTASPGSPTVIPSPSPTGTPTGEQALRWTIRPSQPLPQDIVVYIEQGCWQCDGPTSSLDRVTAIGNPGAVEVASRELFRAPGGPNTYISSFHISPDGHETWLMVCSRGYCGGVGEPTADAQETLYHSDDGGVTWNEVETFDGMVGVVTVAAGIPILARTERDASGAYVTSYFTLQGEREFRGPPNSYPLWPTRGDVITWHSEDGRRLLRTDGSVIFESTNPFSVLGTAHPVKEIYLIAWRSDSPQSPPRFGLVEGASVVFEYVATGLSSGFFVNPGAWLDDRTAIGNVGLLPGEVPSSRGGTGQRLVPALIDFETGEITPLEIYGPDFWSDAYQGRVRVQAVDRGSATAQTPYFVDSPGDCLNVRQMPSLSAGIVRCWADGVILWAPGKEPVEADGTTWIPVEGPDGSSGWASAEFLRR